LRPKSTDQYADEITSEVKNWAEIVKISARSNDFMSRILMGGDSNLRIDIFGYDLDAGYEVAQRLFHIINETQGTRNARIFQDMGNPELSVKVDRDRAASVGLTMDDITAAVSTLFQGTITTQYREGEDGYDILLRLEEKYRRTLEDIRRSELKIPTGEVVRLDTVAEVIETTGPVTISRKNQERRVSVFFDTIDRPQGDVMNDVRDRVEKEILLPSGTSIEYGGMIEEQEKSERVMIMMISLGLILVFMVMAAQFESFIHPFIIMFSIPFAFSGVVAVLGITDTPLSMTAYIGIILLVGIVVNNAIVLIDYINLLRTRGSNLRDAIVTSGRQRLRPVLITTLTTILGMLPMALSKGDGSAAWRPLALVVVGGLSVSTIVTMIIIPVLYYIIERHRRAAKRENPA
jgi:multidrug efflux pump subunit AcrB